MSSRTSLHEHNVPTVAPRGTCYLFVYGTLRPSGPMFGMLQNQLLNLYPDEIQADMYLASGAFYPVVVEGTGTVKGVTVQLPIEMLTKLDAMEGVHRSLFRRKAIRTRHNLVVWCYFADKVHYDQKIESGDYFKEDDY